jgi:hypothetical protein
MFRKYALPFSHKASSFQRISPHKALLDLWLSWGFCHRSVHTPWLLKNWTGGPVSRAHLWLCPFLFSSLTERLFSSDHSANLIVTHTREWDQCSCWCRKNPVSINFADPGSGAFFYPWIRAGKKIQSQGCTDTNIPDPIFENLVSVFGLTIPTYLILWRIWIRNLLNPESWMEKSDPGSGINIPDPQHWFLHRKEDATGYDTSWQYRVRTRDTSGQCSKRYCYIKMLSSNTYILKRIFP